MNEIPVDQILIETTISRLRLQKGDMVVLRTPERLPRLAYERMRMEWERVVGDLFPFRVPLLVIDSSVELSILSPESSDDPVI